MHIDDSQHAPTSVGDFLRQYAMIVLSIVTALGFEQGVVSIHDAMLARASRSRIERELAIDLGELRKSKDLNEANAAAARSALRQTFDQERAGEKTGKTDPVAVSASLAKVSLGVSLPSWQRDAWDAAVADQSVGHLETAAQRRYSEIYATARDDAEEARLLLGGEWLTRASDLYVDMRHNSVAARDAEKILARYLIAVEQIDRSLAEMVKLIEASKRAGGKP